MKFKVPDRDPDVISSCHRFWYDELIEGIFDYNDELMYVIKLKQTSKGTLHRVNCEGGPYLEPSLQNAYNIFLIEGILLKQ